MDKKQKWSQDIVVAIILLAASGFLLFNAMTTMSAEARQFPVLILILFIALAVAMLVMGIKDSKDAAEGKTEIKNMELETIKFPMLVFAFIVIYVIAIDLIGFIIPSLIFTAFLMWFNYARNKITLVAVPVGLVAFLYVLFTFILKTKLP